MLSFPPSPSVKIFVARESIDMRKGLDGLAGLVIDVIDEDPQSGHLFVFFNRRRDRMKSLVWDGSGYWMLQKRLEHGRFQIFDRVGASRTAFELGSCLNALFVSPGDDVVWLGLELILIRLMCARGAHQVACRGAEVMHTERRLFQ